MNKQDKKEIMNLIKYKKMLGGRRMKYKVGDIVKLRDDLEDEQEFDIIAGTFVVDEDVLDLKNTPLKIVDYKNKHGFYIVEFEENKKGKICDEMIEGLWEECKPKLKLIDVLNMIAKGELKEGTKVRWDDDIYIYIDKKNLIRDGNMNLLDDIWISNLNDEVELIEPPCEHEWENYETHRIGEGLINKGRRCKKCGLEEVTEKCVPDVRNSIEPAKIEEIQCPEIYGGITHHIIDKLNEVIRVINKE